MHLHTATTDFAATDIGIFAAFYCQLVIGSNCAVRMRSAIFFYFAFILGITGINIADSRRVDTDPYTAAAGFGVGTGRICIFCRSNIDITFGSKTDIFAADITAFDVDIFFSCGDVDIAVSFDCAALRNSCNAAGLKLVITQIFRTYCRKNMKENQ